MSGQLILDKPAIREEAPIWILYGTVTGNSMQLAEESAEKISDKGMEVKVSDISDFDPAALSCIERLLIIVSTDEGGVPPIRSEHLLTFLQSDEAPRLHHLSYSVLALGDSDYYDFCQAGKDFDAAFERLGARKMKERVDCDFYFDEAYEKWIEDVIEILTGNYPK
jgi:sulfite reductase (NADPH) flavoprotein alpha-component